MAAVAHPVVTDLTVHFSPKNSSSTCGLDPRTWHCIEKDLHLDTAEKSAWLHVELANEKKLGVKDLVVTDIRVGKPPLNSDSDHSWEPRPGGIFVLRSNFSGKIDQVVTEVDVLFGVDAVDPRPQWTLTSSPLQLDAQPEVPVARLTVHRGRAESRPHTQKALRVRKDGKFKIVQISDTHMVTGVGVCEDALDAYGKHLPKSQADPLTVNLIQTVLNAEKPDFVVLSGDSLHHGILDSQSAIFKVVAPIIERSIPFAVVFGNHDAEGPRALSRT
jgi:hypothetical protein